MAQDKLTKDTQRGGGPAPHAGSAAMHDVSDVYRNYGAPLKGFISKRVSVREDAEDILQSVFYNLSRVDQEENPILHISSWLYTAARNLITDRGRKKHESEMPVLKSRKSDDDDFIGDISELLSAGDDSPETEYIRSLVWDELQIALDELPDEQRRVFELTELQGFAFKEISEATGIPVNTLISRKRYAVLHLRERLGDLYMDIAGEK